MRYSKKDPKWRAGYRAAKSSAMEKAAVIASCIETAINASSGISPMLWTDKEQREKIVGSWEVSITKILETV